MVAITTVSRAVTLDRTSALEDHETITNEDSGGPSKDYLNMLIIDVFYKEIVQARCLGALLTDQRLLKQQTEINTLTVSLK